MIEASYRWYSVGVYRICPTDSTLFLQSSLSGVLREYLIESEGWRKLCSIPYGLHFKGSSEFDICNEIWNDWDFDDFEEHYDED